MKTTNKKKLAALALVPALGAAAIAGSAFAADSTSTTSIGTASSSWVGKVMGNFRHGGARDSAQFANDLASILGLSATDVRAKLDAGQTPYAIITASGKNLADVQSQLKALHLKEVKTTLDAKVAAGTMTQAQEDAILTNMENRTAKGFGHMNGWRDNTQFANNLASVLGLSATDVKAKLDAGQTPQSIITGAGKSVADVQTQLRALRQTDMKTRLTALVAAGKLIQTQADAIIARQSDETNKGLHFGRMMEHGFGNFNTRNNITGTSTQ